MARTSQTGDRAKASIYARARVPVYWVIDLASRRLENRADPLSDGRYARLDIHDGGDEVPVPGTESVLAIRDLLP